MTTPTSDRRETKRAVLPRDLSEFLIELSIGVHRFAMYPADHPSLQPAVENVLEGLNELLQTRPVLSIGVTPSQLVIEGMATDERHPVLSDLARRLHDHQLAAVAFSRGTTLDEVRKLLETLSAESERGATPVGLLPEEEAPRWETIRLHPVGYDQLEMAGAGKGKRVPRSQQLWINLARSALEVGEEEDVAVEAGPAALARAIRERREAGYDRVIVGYLLQLADELNGAEGAAAEEIREKMAELLNEFDDPTLRRLLKLGGGYAQRKRFVSDLSHSGMAMDAVFKVLRAAAEVEGQAISTSLTRLLSKLAVHAEEGPRTTRAEAREALAENVDRLLSEWELKDPNPDAYTQVLDRMARAAPLLQSLDEKEEDPVAGAERLVQMALEVDAYGPILEKAVMDLLEAGEMAMILALLDRAPEGSEVAAELARKLTTPTQLKRMLAGEDVDVEGLDRLVERLGATAVAPLLEALAESQSRAVRRKIFDVLARVKAGVADAALRGLNDERWYVQRNMLALLQRLDDLPSGFSPLPYLQHDDPRVRREAVPLALRDPSTRERAIAAALADTDERIVRTALLEVQDSLPEGLVPVVAGRLLQSDTFPQLRSLATRTLRNSRSALALESLLEICSGGKTLFGKRKLAPKSPELLAALTALGEGWGDDPRAGWVFTLAAESRDLQIQSAVRGKARTS